MASTETDLRRGSTLLDLLSTMGKVKTNPHILFSYAKTLQVLKTDVHQEKVGHLPTAPSSCIVDQAKVLRTSVSNKTQQHLKCTRGLDSKFTKLHLEMSFPPDTQGLHTSFTQHLLEVGGTYLPALKKSFNSL